MEFLLIAALMIFLIILAMPTIVQVNELLRARGNESLQTRNRGTDKDADVMDLRSYARRVSGRTLGRGQPRSVSLLVERIS